MTTKDRVRQFIVKNFYVAEPDKLPDDASLLERGIIDSTVVLEIIAFVEKTFEIQVSDDDMLPENLDTILRVAAFVERKKTAVSAQ